MKHSPQPGKLVAKRQLNGLDSGEHLSDELAILLGKRFLERRDVKALQHPDGSWTPVRAGKDGPNLPWKMSDLRDHLDGKRTFGHYLVSHEDKCKLFAFDIDLKKTGWTMPVWNEGDDDISATNLETIECNPREVWLDVNNPGRNWLTIQLRCIADALAERTHKIFGCHVAIATSGGKGLHVYGFTDTVPAEYARDAAIKILKSFREPDGSPSFVPTKGTNFWGRPESERSNVEIEVFPKQTSLEGKEFGNLMKLPLGIHRRTGARSKFLTMNAPYDRLVPKSAAAVLEGELPWD